MGDEAMTQPTDAEVEAVARAIARSDCAGHWRDRYADEEWETYVNEARAAIIALDEVRGR